MAGITDYIYSLSCPITKEVRYIGKSNNPNTRLKSHIRESQKRKNPVNCWIKSLLKNGYSPVMTVLLETVDWQKDERRLIAEYSWISGDNHNE